MSSEEKQKLIDEIVYEQCKRISQGQRDGSIKSTRDILKTIKGGM